MSKEALLQFKDPDEVREADIIEMLQNRPGDYKTLTDKEKEFVRNAKARCPRCHRSYDLYDKRQGKVRKFCSKECASKARRTLKVGCAVCGSRHKHFPALSKHIETTHPDMSLDRYYQEYCKQNPHKGTPQPFCRFCGSKKAFATRQSFGYAQCRCVRAERKAIQLEGRLSATTPDNEAKQLKNSIRGLKSVVTRMRNRLLDSEKTRGQHFLHRSRNRGKEHIRANGLIKVGKGYDLESDSHFFGGLFSAYQDVYDQYERVLTAIRDKRFHDANAASQELVNMTTQSGWKQEAEHRNRMYLFVQAITFSDVEAEKPVPTLIPFYMPLRIGYIDWIERLTSKVEYDAKRVFEFMLRHRDEPEFNRLVAGTPETQCPYRICAVDMNRKRRYLLTSEAIYRVRCLWQRLRTEKSRN